MRKGDLKVELEIPSKEKSVSEFITPTGAFRAGDLIVDKNGVRIISQNENEPPNLIRLSDNQLTLADMDIIKVIGKGNGGVVHLVQHKWTGQFFALKVLYEFNVQCCVNDTPEGKARIFLFSGHNDAQMVSGIPPHSGSSFQYSNLSSTIKQVIQVNIPEPNRIQIAKELKINQSAQSPYVVVCYQSFYDNGVISIVLEYMDGGSLADFLKKVQTIPEIYLAAICKQVLMGLLYIHHDKHIIHRDLKPSNLLINHTGAVKITDFGVSAILESTSDQANTLIGTYNYMSPERIRGAKHGSKSDIWSLGLVLLECATGKFPYSPPEDGRWVNCFELMETIVNQPPPCAPSDRFSPEFCSFISACVQKDPNHRHSAHKLMEHPFISMYEESNVDFAAYFAKAGSPLATF